MENGGFAKSAVAHVCYENKFKNLRSPIIIIIAKSQLMFRYEPALRAVPNVENARLICQIHFVNQ